MKPEDLVGERLFGEYTIVKPLAEGAVGAVFLARQESIDKEIAVKVLHERSAMDEEAVERFHREALAISLLSHPNIIRVLIFGRTEDGWLYLAMEYLEGQTLNERLTAGEVDELRVIKIYKQICGALLEAHAAGIVHRDLKPQNILLTKHRGEEDYVKILDFGMAKFTQPETEEAQRRLSKTGIVYGTPAYLSPEQAQALEIDHRADLYSLGAILYELVTGRLPFPADTAPKMLSSHVHEALVPPSEVAPGKVSEAMEMIIMRAMAKNPKDRYPSAREMLAALKEREEALMSSRGVPEAPPTVPAIRAPEAAGEEGMSPELTKLLIAAAMGAGVMFVAMVLLIVVVVVIRG